jgi:hypothetical protein
MVAIVAYKYFMFSKTNTQVDSILIEQAQNSIPDVDFRLALNEPTGDFFYDPWIIRSEFRNTVWEKILNTIPDKIGEARLIKLDPGTCYRSHSDIDDRWHLSILSERSYLINLENDTMYPTIQDDHWHIIDTGIKHSAANFGSKPRTQLVVRKLLKRNQLTNPVKVSITLIKVTDDRRFIFDDIISPWLNKANKNGTLQNFKFEEFEVRLIIESSVVDDLRKTISSHFNLDII